MNSNKISTEPIYGSLTYISAYKKTLRESVLNDKPLKKTFPKEDVYRKVMKEYFHQMKEHLLVGKPLQLPSDLGALEMVIYKVGRDHKVIDYVATHKLWKKKGVKEGLIFKKESYEHTDGYKYLLRWLCYKPYRNRKSFWNKDLIESISPLSFDRFKKPKKKTYPFKSYYTFLYKFRITSPIYPRLSKWLEKDPMRIYTFRKLR